MRINQCFIKFSRYKKDFIPVDSNLEMDQEVSILIEGQVIEIKDETNNDDTIDRTYVIKGLLAEVQ